MAHKRKKAAPPVRTASPQEEALERFKPLLNGDEFARLLAELDRPLYTAIRMNPLKVDPAGALQDYAQRYGWQVTPVPYCDTSWWITSYTVSPSQTVEHRLGYYYIQDAASMLPVELFDFSGLDAPLMLDLAASPGGKTTHMIAKTGDRGLVIANDSSPSRITALKLVLENWGAANAAVTRFPGEKFGAWYPETFDCILLDAPCSMQGLHTTESHPMRAITEKEQGALAVRQTSLLKSAFRALKTGGQLVYSTCTLEPGEDEGVLDELLRQFPGSAAIEDLSSRLPAPAPALAAAGERRFDPSVQRAARLWPQTFGTSGFFAARVSKRAPVVTEEEPAPVWNFERTGFERLSRREQAELAERLRSVYAFDLPGTLEEQGLSLWRRGEQVFALPEAFLGRFPSLPFQSLGLLVGEEGPVGFVPSHEWLARFSRRFPNGHWQLADEFQTAWLRGEDIRLDLTGLFPRSTIVLVDDPGGRFLGRGRVTAERLKNLLPRRFVF